MQHRVDAIRLGSRLSLELLLLPWQGYLHVFTGHFFLLRNSAFIFLLIDSTNSSLSGTVHNVDLDLPLRDLLLSDVGEDVDQRPEEDVKCFICKDPIVLPLNLKPLRVASHGDGYEVDECKWDGFHDCEKHTAPVQGTFNF